MAKKAYQKNIQVSFNFFRKKETLFLVFLTDYMPDEL